MHAVALRVETPYGATRDELMYIIYPLHAEQIARSLGGNQDPTDD